MGAVMRNVRHGGPYDRGSADAYYRRPYGPHYYRGATYSSALVTEAWMTAEQIAEYAQGWEDTHKQGIFK